MREKTKFNIISFTRQGFLLSRRMRDALLEISEFPGGESVRLCAKMNCAETEILDGEEACLYVNKDSEILGFREEMSVRLYTKKDAVAEEFPEAEYVSEPLKDWCARVFSSSAALIFVGAAGIAVRTIAPFLDSKTTDPAVLVADEQGRHIISLLSGHLGGGNELTKQLAARLGADPVITTASDVNGRLAVDVWAQKNNCVIANLSAAKRVAAELVAGKRIPVSVEVPMEGELPEAFALNEAIIDVESNLGENVKKLAGLPENDLEDKNEEFFHQNGGERNVSDKVSITISVFRDYKSEKISVSLRGGQKINADYDFVKCEKNLHLIPRTVVLGIGCKKGKSLAEIRDVLMRVLEEQNLCVESIGAVASIDLKRDEPGLVALAEELNAPFLTFSAEKLKGVPGEYAPSAFVEKTTGVDNVCERAAMAALTPEEQKTARFLCRKQAADGVTVALLLKPWKVE